MRTRLAALLNAAMPATATAALAQSKDSFDSLMTRVNHHYTLALFSTSAAEPGRAAEHTAHFALRDLRERNNVPTPADKLTLPRPDGTRGADGKEPQGRSRGDQDH